MLYLVWLSKFLGLRAQRNIEYTAPQIVDQLIMLNG